MAKSSPLPSLENEELDETLAETEAPGAYFASPGGSLNFIHSGSTGLDCVLGGGWACGRVSNVIGDKSAGKTLLAIEAMANCTVQYDDPIVRYNEVESAFDDDYAAALGLPLDSILFERDCRTVEDMADDISDTIALLTKDQVGMYVVDSLDALSDKTELAEDIDAPTYGAKKAKMMSKMFRQLVQEMGQSNLHFMVISQVRDNLGFGPTKNSRSGGRALDFYASQVIELQHKGTIDKSIGGVKRIIGIDVRARCTKNKVGLPFREFEFPLKFGYGVDDLYSMVQWFHTIRTGGKSLDLIRHFLPETTARDKIIVDALLKLCNKLPDDEYWAVCDNVATTLKREWSEIETSFLPTRQKRRG